MLHKDCFGTFDLVLVDLSETVMSFQVMDELEVLEALALLVKPDDIFVMSEVYFSHFKKYFHTLLKSIGKVRLSTYPWNMFITNTLFSTYLCPHFTSFSNFRYDNPIICSQIMVMGSRTIEFMHPTVDSVSGCRKSIVMSIVLQEGYVVARAMVENHCCGFDVYFWSSWANTRLRKMPLQ
jgi:hypothetical protein